MLANQRDELLCGYEKCDRIYETQQSQNDKTRQPIRISECEKLYQKPLVGYSATLAIGPLEIQCSNLKLGASCRDAKARRHLALCSGQTAKLGLTPEGL